MPHPHVHALLARHHVVLPAERAVPPLTRATRLPDATEDRMTDNVRQTCGGDGITGYQPGAHPASEITVPCPDCAGGEA